MLWCVILGSFVWGVLSQDLDEACKRREDITGPYVPPKVIVVREKGNLYSPGFENNQNYPDAVQCNYQLQAPQGMHIRLKFNEIDIDVTESCQSDNLNIHDFNSQGQGVLISRICGKQRPFDYVSNSFAVQLVLVTDEFAGRRGFNITYSVQDNNAVCSRGLKQCRNRNCVSYSDVCDGKDDCGDGTDEENCGKSLETQECGKPEISPVTYADQDRIVGGKEAVEGSWPWMADLQAKIIEPNGHVCGGALINSQWVLSAAHCFGGEPMLRRPSGWRIHLGNYRKFDKDEHEQIRYVERIIIYDDIPSVIFERNGEFDLVHDVALLKLNAPVKYTKYVKPICLPDRYAKLDIVSNCYATGWGATRGTGSSHLLKQAYHPVQPDILCRRLVGNEYTNETMICAGSMAPLNGVCHGDSGGPLVCEFNKVWSVFGVASFVTDGNGDAGLCGLKGRPSVFNKIAVKTAWIRRMINRYS